MSGWQSDLVAAAEADAFWERALKGDVAGCVYHEDGDCSHANRACADAIRAAKERQEPSSKWCAWAPGD